ncbi:membrane protein insertase YidC [Mycoplasma sp. NEAQ87857]|nr:membrane protein insertase YidC [Mycoplasma sp. NEAQ87857]
MLYRYSFGENSTIYNEINKDRTNKITFAQYIDEIMSSEDLVAYNEFRNFGNFKLTGEALTKVEAVKTKLNQLNDEFAKNNPGKDKEADVNQFKASVNKYIATVETMEKISALLEKLKANNNFVFADKDQKISDIQTKITALRSGLINLSELNTNNLVSKVQNFEKAQNSNLEYSGDYFKLTTLLKVKLPKKQVEILQAYNDVVTNYLLATSYNINITNNGKVGIANIKGLNPVDSLVLRGDVSQRPITSWKEAWEFGPFFGLLVFPLARLMQSIRQSMPDLNGWASIISLIIAIVLTRLLSLAITFKSTMTQSVQEDLKVKKASIEAKYKGFENNKAMKMRKQQEISSLYSKYNLNPLDTFGSMLISIPIFLAMWRVIQGLPEIKATEWLGINFSTTSWQSLLQGNWVYLWVIVAAVVVQLLSQLLPQLLNRKRLRQRTTIAEVEALKKSERTQRIMLIVFTVITIIFTAGVQLYWMFAGIWTIGQVLVLHKIKQTKWFKYKYSVKAYKK